MPAYIVRRLLATLPVMLLVALFVFSLLYLTPGDPAALMAGDQATPDQIAHIREALGLDRPFLVRFFDWLWHVLQGDLGTSLFSNLPVSTMIGQCIEPTLALTLVALPLSVLTAVPMGVIAARKPGALADRAVMVLAVLGFSMPVFVIGYMLVYVFPIRLGWFQVAGYSPIAKGILPWLQSITLPAVALSGIYIALIARITRATMLDVLSQDYIRTARAKGLNQAPVLLVHALRNAAVPIVTVIGLGFAALIGGAVVTERVFAIPGLGQLTVDSVLRRDYPVVQGVVLLLSLAYVLVNLIVDILYTVFDPRIRY